ncbi:Bug family tripartite tricarboxylate transporter substrate binding protein [Xenophilus azovorans]|uniref:Bug family tripartite tricarboxylate transporter substrate binding protein n=1 Tax=Xenophilus azovorans TaxID=151755 RepID=UPI00056DC70B|nr:tripartite tricarboxylate transporter substrate binding protein [Xenophilus azovorans]
MMMMNRRALLGALGACALAQPAAAQADYPNRPIRIIVPLPPGSPPDVLARVVGERLQHEWKQPVVVENRPGATGMIGLDAVAKAPPDGYTVGIMFLTHTVLPALFGRTPYDTQRDLAPLANLAWLYNVLVVPANSPARSVRDLVQRAGAQPDALTYGSGGIGSPAHLLGAAFCQTTGTRMLHVPFKGPSESVQGLLGGQVDAMFATTSVAVPMVRGGKLRPLAVTSPARLAALPEVPTIAESGITGFEIREWEGIVAPAGLPAALVDRWSRALARIMSQQEVKDRLLDLGMTAAEPDTPAAFGTLIGSELAYWSKLVKSAGLKAQ